MTATVSQFVTQLVTQLPKPSHAEAQSSTMLDEYLAPLLPFLQDSSLTEICVNRPFEVWTEGRSGWSQHAVPYLSFAHCRQLATLIASFNGKAITSDKPVLSASLPTGERVQVLIPPACEAFTVSITVRKPSIIAKTLEELLPGGVDRGRILRVAGVQRLDVMHILPLEERRILKDRIL